MKLKHILISSGLLMSATFGADRVPLSELEVGGNLSSSSRDSLTKPAVAKKSASRSRQESEGELETGVRTKPKTKNKFSVTWACKKDSCVKRTDESRLREASVDSPLPVLLSSTGNGYDQVMIQLGSKARSAAELSAREIPSAHDQNLEMEAEFLAWEKAEAKSDFERGIQELMEAGGKLSIDEVRW